MSIKLSYEDFISIASISDPENFAHGLRADKNGVYAIRPFRPELLEDEELACIRPRNGWEEPMLRFPCSPDEMRIFFDDSCMAGYKESLDSFIKQSYISHEEASPPEHGMSERHKIHVFSAEERNKGDRKGCLQYAVEAYLDKNVDGEWKGFMKFINAKLQLPKEETLCKEQSYNYYFEKVTNTVLFLKQPKQGKKKGEQGWSQHSADSVNAVIRAEKRKRKKQNN